MIESIKKQCSICKEWLPSNLNYFYKHKSNKDGLYPYCKNCTREKTKQWGKDNPEKYKALNKRKAENRPEEYKIMSREAAKRNREEGYQKEWRKNNKDKLKQYNEYRALNKTHDITNEEWEVCKRYFNHSCAYCGLSENEAKEQYNQYFHKEHVDHDGANDISNCVPACKSCNSRKHTMSVEEWLERSEGTFTKERLFKIYDWLDNYQEYIK